MRYLRQQNINRRAPFDQRLYVDMTSSVIMDTTNHLMLPKGTTAERPANSTWVEGMIRYNETTHEVEVYQGIDGGATWRSLGYKESIGIIQQDLGLGDFVETLFGPLDPAPPAVTDSNIEWAAHGNALTPGNAWTGANLIVIVENVIQIFNTNYTIVVDPVGKTAGTYISFDSPVPLGKPVIVLHGFDR